MLERSILGLEKANEAKSVFLSVMSHEMRTSLNGILGFIQMLNREDLTTEQHEIVSIMEGSSRTLLSLINDILDVEKYSAGKMLFDEAAFNFAEAIQEGILGFKGLVENKGLQFDTSIESTLDCQVIGDETKLKQLMNNLLNNALKFTNFTDALV